ncbi:MAG: hypothetical protein HRT90_07805 [Candidatus Margulisbacteria bacterium]|nr:hypothetical protein [Candidatus Margulisiibacteriota bacterium]
MWISIAKAIMTLFLRLIWPIVILLNIMRGTLIAVIFIPSFLCVYLFYRITHWHGLYYRFLKAVVSYYMVSNGIRLKYDKQTFESLSKCVLIVNGQLDITMWWLFLICPYNTIKICPDTFFSTASLMFLFTQAGFYPREYFDFKNYQAKTFQAETYLSQEFVITEGIRTYCYEKQPTPFSVMLAIKQRVPVKLVTIKDPHVAKFSTLFTPQTITISMSEEAWVPTGDISKDTEEFRRLTNDLYEEDLGYNFLRDATSQSSE